MANIKVTIHDYEKDKLVEVIKKNQGKTIAVSALAIQAGYNPNRTRFIIEDLIQEGRIERIPTKVFNPRYIRYSYKVVK